MIMMITTTTNVLVRRESDARMEKKIKLEDMLETEKRFKSFFSKAKEYYKAKTCLKLRK